MAGPYRGIVPDEYLAGMSYENGRSNWEMAINDPQRRTSIFVAEDDADRVVGFAACGPLRGSDPVYKAELYAIYVLQDVQRAGIGKRLVGAVVHDLKRRGYQSLLVCVLADNPARRFYETLGGQYEGSREIPIGGRVLKEMAYGWGSLDSLQSPLS